jgi:5-methyltetrahydrofolate--homocysteine methyltransferase
MMSTELVLERIKKAVVDGEQNNIRRLVEQSIRDNSDPDRVVKEALIAAMDIVGKRYTENEIYVPEMLASAMTMKKGLEVIKPLLTGTNALQSRGTAIIGTVKGDLHDIGKNLVIMMLESAGFNVIDLGTDVSVNQIMAKVRELSPHILGLSALLTTTMEEMSKVIRTLEEKGMRKNVNIMVGGAPVDAEFARNIGADGYGKDAGEAVWLAKELMSDQTYSTSELRSGKSFFTRDS